MDKMRKIFALSIGPRPFSPASAGLAVLLSCFALPARADYVAPHLAREPIGEIKIVVPISSGDYGLLRMKLRNILNAAVAAKEGQGHLEARMVFYAQAPKLLATADLPADVRQSIDAVRAAGVGIELCNNSLREQGLDFHALYGVNEADIVPSGFLEVAWLQSRGFVVGPSN
jgi:intracellular sulfur oxidation DsrE/DsrF family protein